MINSKLRGLVVLSGFSALADVRGATPPPDNVTSDTHHNTAMGSGVLSNCTPPACTANTAAGAYALGNLTTANSNTAFGAYPLFHNTTGLYNTAVGSYALFNTVPNGTAATKNANGNTGIGAGSLFHNTSGYYNTAVGAYTLLQVTTGSNNTACGAYAMLSQTGSNNTATGAYALHGNNTTVSSNTGSGNTASGFRALEFNEGGANNTGFGMYTLIKNTSGKGNAAQGVNALSANTTGIRNVAIGNNAMLTNSTGSYNSAIGFQAGYNTTGNDNIYINNTGLAGDAQTMRLGTQGSSGVLGSGILSAYIAGVYTVQVTGNSSATPVYITSTGQLGIGVSSERFKTDIAPMPDLSARLDKLRPVTFHYKTDPKGVPQYGLIAEEVAKVYPELVVRDDAGAIQGVRYEELAPMLLDQLQRQRTQLEQQSSTIKSQSVAIDEMRRQLAELRSLGDELRARKPDPLNP